jgi:endonuclease/exonuclease/phosphatase family metal-dependent hydrolase
MTFNVENLFDTRNDPGKADETFLPLSAKQSKAHRKACARIQRKRWRTECYEWDWNESVLDHKLTVVASAILQVNDGRGPDIVALQEVENLAVLEHLRNEYLAPAGYLPGILIEGGDNRGIDVAFLTRLPVVGRPLLHKVPFAGFSRRRIENSRGILEATFKLPDGTLLTGFAVHLPSPANPREMRATGYQFINELKDRLPEDRAVFAAGDFNTPSREDAQHRMLERLVRPSWRVAHEEGCPGCPSGSSYFAPERSWSFLDMILWSAGSEPGRGAMWDLRVDKTFVANGARDQVRRNGTPASFQLPQVRGVSDHWPVVVTIEKVDDQQG